MAEKIDPVEHLEGTRGVCLSFNITAGEKLY